MTRRLAVLRRPARFTWGEFDHGAEYLCQKWPWWSPRFCTRYPDHPGKHVLDGVLVLPTGLAWFCRILGVLLGLVVAHFLWGWPW